MGEPTKSRALQATMLSALVLVVLGLVWWFAQGAAGPQVDLSQVAPVEPRDGSTVMTASTLNAPSKSQGRAEQPTTAGPSLPDARRPSFRIAGVVRDTSGRGIDGVGVRLLSISGQFVSRQTRSAIAGTFAFGDLSEGTFELSVDPRTLPSGYVGPMDRHGLGTEAVEAAGHLLLHPVTLDASHTEAHVEIVLVRAGVVSGVLHGPGGVPIPQAHVRMALDIYQLSYDTRTDRFGRFGYPSIYPGSYSLQVWLIDTPFEDLIRPDRKKVIVPAGGRVDTGVALAIRGDRTIRGQVIDQHSQPLQDAPILVYPKGAWLNDGTRRTRTNDKGEFEISGLAPRLLHLAVAPEGTLEAWGKNLLSVPATPVVVDTAKGRMTDLGKIRVSRSEPFRLDAKVLFSARNWPRRRSIEYVRYVAMKGIYSLADLGAMMQKPGWRLSQWGQSRGNLSLQPKPVSSHEWSFRVWADHPIKDLTVVVLKRQGRSFSILGARSVHVIPGGKDELTLRF